jgi:hypothetical protein
MQTNRLLALALLVAGTIGCGGADSGGDGSGEIIISGAVYVDFHTDSPCHVRDAPQELSGVTVKFRGPQGESLGDGLTGPVGFMLLEFGEGKRGWTHPGCRYFASYSASVAPAASYEASFESPQRQNLGAGSWFTGVEDLEAQVISHEELEGAGFGWDFEADPSYVVGH